MCIGTLIIAAQRHIGWVYLERKKVLFCCRENRCHIRSVNLDIKNKKSRALVVARTYSTLYDDNFLAKSYD